MEAIPSGERFNLGEEQCRTSPKDQPPKSKTHAGEVAEEDNVTLKPFCSQQTQTLYALTLSSSLSARSFLLGRQTLSLLAVTFFSCLALAKFLLAGVCFFGGDEITAITWSHLIFSTTWSQWGLSFSGALFVAIIWWQIKDRLKSRIQISLGHNNKEINTQAVKNRILKKRKERHRMKEREKRREKRVKRNNKEKDCTSLALDTFGIDVRDFGMEVPEAQKVPTQFSSGNIIKFLDGSVTDT